MHAQIHCATLVFDHKTPFAVTPADTALVTEDPREFDWELERLGDDFDDMPIPIDISERPGDDSNHIFVEKADPGVPQWAALKGAD